MLLSGNIHSIKLDVYDGWHSAQISFKLDVKVADFSLKNVTNIQSHQELKKKILKVPTFYLTTTVRVRLITTSRDVKITS